MTQNLYNRPPVQDHQPSILIFDDDTLLAYQWAEALQKAGYRTEVSHRLATAERLLKKQQFDLIICDLLIRDPLGEFQTEGGFSLMSFIHRRSLNSKFAGMSPPKILVISGAMELNMNEFSQSALSLGATRVLQKPISDATLVAHVHSLL